MQKENQVDINTPEGKELLLQYVGSIQRIDNNIKQLKEEKLDILKRAKDEGFNKSIINKTIAQIRKENNTTDIQDMELETYYILIKESGIVN